MKNILNLLKFHIGSLIVYVKKNFKIISVFDDVKHQIDRAEGIEDKIRQDVALWKNEHPFEEGDRMARKWFAQDVANKTKYTALYFAAYDGRLDSLFTDMPTSKFISLFKIELPKEV